LEADYITTVKDRSIMSAEYRITPSLTVSPVLAFLVLTGKRGTTIPQLCVEGRDAEIRSNPICRKSFTVRVVRKEQGAEWLKATRGWDIGPLTRTFLPRCM